MPDILAELQEAPEGADFNLARIARHLTLHVGDILARQADNEVSFEQNIGGGIRPDLVLRDSSGNITTIVETQLWSEAFGASRVSSALGRSVMLRRAAPSATVSLVSILLPGAQNSDAIDRRLAILTRLVRDSGNDAGFDNVIVGVVQDMAWYRFIGRVGDMESLPSLEYAARAAMDLSPYLAMSQDPANQNTVARPPRRTYLLVADEWFSRKGGLSTFNRDMAKALVANDCQVFVAVPRIDTEEARDADEHGVVLVQPDAVPGVSGATVLLTRPRLPEHASPDVIIGHGRILGPYAYALQSNFYQQAKRVHVVHTSSEHLEVAKEEDHSRMSIASKRWSDEVQLAQSADLVLGVGPLLSRHIEDALRRPGARHPRVMEFRPGISSHDDDDSGARYPNASQVLLLGRAEDAKSKGIFVALKAVSKAAKAMRRSFSERPVLVIRGIPDDEGANHLKKQLDKHRKDIRVLFREYTTNREELLSDLSGSRLVVMPSIHEGFGLSALEAMAFGVPTLITEDSGLAELIREISSDGERHQPREIQPSTGDGNAVKAWSQAMVRVLEDPEAAFTRAATLKSQLTSALSWETSTAQLISIIDSLE